MACGKSCHVFLTVTFLMVTCFLMLPESVTASSNIYASACTGQKLQISCPQYHRIAIKRIFYGVKRNWDCRAELNSAYQSGRGAFDSQGYTVNVSSSDCCRATHLDCQVDDDGMFMTLNTKCSGYQGCEAEVQKVPTSGLCRFKAYTDYMTIVYDCVSVGDIATFCSDDVKRGKALYIANKEYPSASSPKSEPTECKCIVRTDHPQGISIHTIDVLLTWANRETRECWQSLKVQDPTSYHREIPCAHVGLYGFKSLYSRTVHNVTITLSSLPGDGMAFVWLLAKPNDAEGLVEIFCGKSLQSLLNRLKHQSESRQREKAKERERELEKEREKNKEAGSGTGKIEDDDVEDVVNGTNVASSTNAHSLNSDLAAIVGGIVAAGFILIAMVIIAMALHCRRVRKEQQPRPLERYPAVSSEPLDLASYCKYDYDDDHLCSISRSPVKMASLTDEGPVANGLRPNGGFTTIAHAEEYPSYHDRTPSPPLPPGLSTPPPSAQNQPLLAGRSYREVHYPGDMSLRFVKPLVNNSNTLNPKVDTQPPPQDYNVHSQGHTTLPANRKAVLISSGPKSPLGKRSKSVTFSQPVAMVTPLNSESEESMEKSQVSEDVEDPSYDNLNKLDIPDHPIMPGKPELIKIPRWDKVEYREESPARPMSTFQNSPSPQGETKVFFPPPPPDLKFTSDSDDTAYMSDSSSNFWSPTRQNGKPLVLPKPQKAELYETGV